MRVLVYPHDLAIGGSQINAIEIARGVADLGHEVTVYGYPGPLVDKVTASGLDFVASPRPGRRPSPSVLLSLSRVVRSRGIDVLHGYEWPPILESWLVARRTGRVAVGTVMSMAVADFLPRHLPLLVGTEQIADAERRAGRASVGVLEPPVDLSSNNTALLLDTAGFRAQHGIRQDDVLVVVVSRLAVELKREGLVTAARVVGQLAQDHPVRLVIVGDGPAREDLRSVVAGLPGRHTHPPVILAGEMADPRAAYAAADITLGMGSSALRAMAFGRPLVVQGENGFWGTLRPETLDRYLWTGWYGVGEGTATGEIALRREILPLVRDAGLRERLGAFALAVVRDRFSLESAARRQVGQYEAELAARRSTASPPRELSRSGWAFARYTADRYAQRVRGQLRTDDFNARPVAAQAQSASAEPA